MRNGDKDTHELDSQQLRNGQLRCLSRLVSAARTKAQPSMMRPQLLRQNRQIIIVFNCAQVQTTSQNSIV